MSVDLEAIYHSGLASIDEITDYDDRALLIMNWTKYVLIMQANVLTAQTTAKTLGPAFAVLCAEFAMKVLTLPEVYFEHMDTKPCGKCRRCIEAGIKASDEPSDEPAN